MRVGEVAALTGLALYTGSVWVGSTARPQWVVWVCTGLAVVGWVLLAVGLACSGPRR